MFHTRIKVRLGDEVNFRTSEGIENQESGLYETTVGRIYFNDVLPVGMDFYDMDMSKGNLNQVIHDCYQLLGRKSTLALLDDLKELGFKSATIAVALLLQGRSARARHQAEDLESYAEACLRG